MDKDKFLSTGLLELYILGLTSPEEAEEVDRYLNAFPELKDNLSKAKGSFDAYVEKNTPRIRLKKRVNGKYLSFYAAVASILLLLGSFYYFSNQLSRQEQKIIALNHSITECEKETILLKNQKQLFAFLSHPETEVLRISSSQSKEEEAIFYYNRDLKKVFCNSSKLKKPGGNNQYQVWADVDGEMVNMGLIEMENSKLQVLEFHEDSESINVTIEPEGGSVHPTVEKIIGSVST